MTIRDFLPVVITISTLWLPILGQAPQGAKAVARGNILERSVPGNDLEYLTTRAAFGRGLSSAHVAGGIASSATGCEEEPITQRWMPLGSSLRYTLDSIVLADPSYKWITDSDVVNLLPREGEPALLSTRIESLNIDIPTDIDWVLDRLLNLPEVRQRREDLGLDTGLQLIVRPGPKK